jgi:hypothetical protein
MLRAIGLDLAAQSLQVERAEASRASSAELLNCGMMVAAKTAMITTTINTSTNVNA